MELSKVPAHLAIIGAGVIGLELGSVYARLGAKITVIEYLDRILPGMDLEVAKNFQRLLQKQGFTFKLSSKVTSATKTNRASCCKLNPTPAVPQNHSTADTVLVAVGRTPFTEGLGCEKAGIKRDDKGRIEVGATF